MQTTPIHLAIQQICEEKNIPYDAVIETIEAFLKAKSLAGAWGSVPGAV